jgi:hypothetical protein
MIVPRKEDMDDALRCLVSPRQPPSPRLASKGSDFALKPVAALHAEPYGISLQERDNLRAVWYASSSSGGRVPFWGEPGDVAGSRWKQGDDTLASRVFPIGSISHRVQILGPDHQCLRRVRK